MTNLKTIKRALLSSVIALLVCFSMLVGTTFAWFTDSVTSSNNIIQTGTLDVSLEHSDDLLTDVDDEGWTDASTGAIFNYSNWEPGYTVVKYVKIENEGTLDLKFILNIVPNNAAEEVNLADVIEVYMIDSAVEVERSALTTNSEAYVGTLTSLMNENDGAAHGVLYADDADKAGNVYEIYTIALKMSTSAGNEYKGRNVGGGFAVQLLATQLASESDSIGGDYDEKADYDGEISNATSLSAALKNGGAYKLIKDVELDVPVNVDNGVTVDLNLNGYDIITTVKGNAIVNNGTLTIDGVKMATSYGLRSVEVSTIKAIDGYAINNNGEMTIDNIVIDGGIYNAGALTIEGGEVANTTSGRHTIYHCGTLLEINGGIFENTSQNEVINSATGNVTIDGGTFTMVGKSYLFGGNGITINDGIFNGYVNEDGTNDAMRTGITVNGGTFNFDVSKWVSTGKQSAKLDGAYIVIPENQAVANNDEELDTAITNGKTTIILGSGNYIIPDSAQGKTLTFIGNGETVVATQDDGSYEGCDYSLDGSTVTFEGITINTDSSTYTGYARLNATYKNCTINGTYTLYGNSVFDGCTFNVSGDVYNIWTWGAPKATFNNCTFNSDGKALLLYGTENTELIVNNCVFNDNGGLSDLKAAIEIGNDYGKSYSLTVTNTVVNGYEINDKGINTGSTLWANKNSMSTENLNVIVDNVDVY